MWIVAVLLSLSGALFSGEQGSYTTGDDGSESGVAWSVPARTWHEE